MALRETKVCGVGHFLAARWIIAFFVVVQGLIATQAGAAVVTTIYSSYADNNSHGVTFLGAPVDAIPTVDLEQFGANVSWNWHPDGLANFAADSLAYINLPVANSLTFIDSATQTSYVFVDGVLAVTHSSFFVAGSQTTLPLSAGTHSVEVQYEIVNPPGSESGFEITITPGNGFSFVPEPSGLAALAVGGLGVLARRRR
jgi:hypothetical protein